MLCAEINTNSLPPFKSLCIGEQSTGFNWVNGKWKQTNFNSSRYVLEKIDYSSAMKSKNPIEIPISCKAAVATKVNSELTIVEACYLYYEFGVKPIIMINANMCYESFENGNIKDIDCTGKVKFKPNGLFVALPSNVSMDITNSNYKDSIAITVGTCGQL